MRVAIVGSGPRGLWAAEALMARVRERGAGVHVDVYDDRPPGVGAGYAPGQPDSWRLNVTSAIVRSGLGSFDDWRRERGERDPLDPFPPRSRVGEFLAASWDSLLADVAAAGPGSVLRHVPRRVETVAPVGDGWSLDGEVYDEVLLATGHADGWLGRLAHGWEGPADLVPAVAPDHLSAERVPPGARVALRGAALTFIDAALELTEGRGGRFEPAGAGLAYVPSGREPAVLWPTSRGGRFLEAKPDPHGPLSALPLGEAVDRGSDAVRAAPDLAGVEEALAGCAREFLAVAGEDPAAVQPTIEAVLAGSDASGDPVADLRRSRDVAVGRRPPDAVWALGEAWRRLYPALVERVSFGGRDTLGGFDDLAARMERAGFGPPPVNASKVLALIDAGLVDATHLADPDTAMARADVVVDAVIAPPGVVPGTLVGDLVDAGIGAAHPGARGWAITPDGSVVGAPHLAAVGRSTEDVTLGNDTLSRTLHDVVERWARRVADEAPAPTAAGVPAATAGIPVPAPPGVHGTPPLTARLEPWLADLLADADTCDALLREHGSPVNVLNPAPLLRNADELVVAGRDAGVDVRVFFARKANKALAFVDAVRDAGHGVDVASERELRQVLEAGVPGERIILSAAVKPDALLALAVDSGTTVSVDSVAELDRLAAVSAGRGPGVRIAPRVAPDPAHLPPTRFGERVSVWADALGSRRPGVEVAGVHVHLHGYAAADRRRALSEALDLVDALVAAGHAPEFVDLGGGVPMSYLDDADQWQAFQAARTAMVLGEAEPFTWKADPLANTYPFHQSPVRGAWLDDVLTGRLPDGTPAAEGLGRRGLRLHLEPGRALLDGCGATLARVAFVKTRSDGVPLVGLEMNRTQCRSTSDDFLVDPVLVRRVTGADADPLDAFLVGAYCIEDELILKRRMRFPRGVAAGDVIALPNTAGYLMHILESASHQIPLARNVALDDGGFALDRIDAVR